MILLNKRIKSFLLENKGRYAKGTVALLFINLLQISIPKITGKLIDSIQYGNIGINGSVMYSLFVVIISILIFALNYLTRLQIMGASLLFQYQTRNNMFKHLEGLSMSFFNKNSVGDIMALSVNDVSAIRAALGRGFNLIIDTFFLLFLSLIIMGKTANIRLTLMVFMPIPILIFIVAKFGLIINKRFKSVQESFGRLTTKVQENISGIRVIKAFAQEKEEMDNFQVINRKNYEVNIQLVKVWGIFYPLIEFIISLSYLIVLVYGSGLVLKGSLTLGDFIAVNGYIGILVRPIRFIGTIVNVIQKGKASMERIEELFNEKPGVVNRVGKNFTKLKKYNSSKTNVKVINSRISERKDIFNESAVDYFDSNSKELKLKGYVEFKNLTFSYSDLGKPVLKNINLLLEPGKTVAVVGKVGSGKSTLANLILRLYDPSEKRQITVDGMNITEVPLDVLRNSIGYVPQENFLFSQSIKDNIAFSEYNYSMNKIEEVAKISQIYDSILDFPSKFDTILGERGINLSGGQKQRISIARAIIREPSIIILDDCLSAIDTNTEHKILEGLRTIMKSCSSLIISHRISSIKYADEIIVLDKGAIVERGTHEELLGLGGLYFRMYEKQLLEDRLKDI